MPALKLERGSGLVVVAHPDDETIWMGGTILANPQIHWTIFSLCRANDHDRAPKFRKVMRRYGARSIITDLEDEGVMNISVSLPKIKTYLLKKLRVRSFDYIFTHAYNGEYGHPRHKGVHRGVKDLLRRNKINAGKTFTFAYVLDERKGYAISSESAAYRVVLSSASLKIKKHIIQNLYGFAPSSFEARSSARTETFNFLL